MLKFLVVFFLSLSLLGIAEGYTGDRVIDHADLLKRNEILSLERSIKDIEQENKVTIFIVTCTYCEDQGVNWDQIHLLYAEEDTIKDEARAILLTVAALDRNLRIDYGMGLEGKLIAEKTNWLIETAITPNFRGGSYYYGLDLGLHKLKGLLQNSSSYKEFKAAEEKWKLEQKQEAKEKELLWPSLSFIGLLIMSIILIMKTKWYVASPMGFLLGFFYADHFFAYLPASIIFGLFFTILGLSKILNPRPIVQDKITRGYFGVRKQWHSSFRGGGRYW